MKLKEWGRKHSLGCAIDALFMGALGGEDVPAYLLKSE